MSNIRRIIIEAISNDIWYHGSADARGLENGFQQKKISTTIITDVPKYYDIMEKLNAARKTDKKLYFKILDKVSDVKKNISMKAPIFFTNNRTVANTYADDKRAFDYQNAVPKVLAFHIDPGKNAEVHAHGQRFRNIDVDLVKKGFVNAGASKEEVDLAFEKFNWIQNSKGTTTNTTIGLIAQYLGFDSVDVLGVFDSYHGGTIPSNIRMVWDIRRIRPIK